MVGLFAKRMPKAKCIITLGSLAATDANHKNETTTAATVASGKGGGRRLDRAIQDHNFAKQVSELLTEQRSL